MSKKEDWDIEQGSTTCLDEGEAVYVRFEMRLGISRSLAVNPARMTQSELAIHSMHSVMVVHDAEVTRIMVINAYHRKYRNVALQHPKKWLAQDTIGRDSITK